MRWRSCTVRAVRKLWLALSVLNSLGVLGFFKYAAFFAENLNAMLRLLHVPLVIPDPAAAGVLLPVGISFYTFQSMSYTIDCYRGRLEREPSFIRFATFVALFPQLLAGPIERAGNLLPQLADKPPIRRRDVADGFSLFLVGLFRKVALADYFAQYVEKVYAAPDMFSGGALVLATFAFGWQIYFDFSGYTDTARGVARMMGFQLMLNFNNPYMQTAESRERGRQLEQQAQQRLAENGIPHYVAAGLSSEQYADASHPLAAGYAKIAHDLFADAGFREWFEE